MARELRRNAGVTLVEVMVVVVIAAILMVAIGRAMTRRDNDSAVQRLATELLVTVRQARSMAVESGGVVQVWFRPDGLQFSLQRAMLLGQGSPTGNQFLRVSEVRADSLARVQAVHAAAEVGVVATPGTDGLTLAGAAPKGVLSFNPNGTATAATVYLRDESAKYHYKVVVFGLTGFSQLITRW